MRRSREVQITLLASLALTTLTACRDQRRDCIDQGSHLLPDSACRANPAVPGAHYIHGGSSGGHVGDMVIGGSSTASIFRGGFGGHGEAGGE